MRSYATRSSSAPSGNNAVNQLVTDHYALALTLAHSAQVPDHSPYDREDLEQEAALALVEAAHSYNPSSSTKFSTYAYKCISGKIKNFLNRDSRDRFQDEYDDEVDSIPAYWDIVRPEQFLNLYEKASTLNSAISGLPPTQSSMLEAACTGDTVSEIAELAGVSRPWVSTVVRKSSEAVADQISMFAFAG